MERGGIKFDESTKENRRKGAERIIEFLKESGTFAYLSSKEAKRSAVDSITVDQAIDFLERLNGIIINTPIHQREALVHSGVIRIESQDTPSYMPPDTATQYICIEIILKHMKAMDLGTAGTYAGIAINLLHMFPDGNGRLARLIDYLLIDSPDEEPFDLESEEGLEYLDKAMRKRSMNTDPSIIEDEVNEIIRDDILASAGLNNQKIKINPLDSTGLTITDSMYGSSDLNDTDENLIKYFRDRAIIDPVDFNYGVLSFITRRSELLEMLPKEGGSPVIDVGKFLENQLSPKEIRHLYLDYQNVKLSRFNIFADILEHPERFPLKWSEKHNLKQLFEQRVDDANMKGMDLNFMKMSG